MSFSKPVNPPNGVELKHNDDGTDNAKYIDLLDEDKPIAGQKFACLSFISPEEIIRNKQLFFFEKCAHFQLKIHKSPFFKMIG